jgi:hypothetical protein
MNQTDTYTLFSAALEVINGAIDLHGNRFTGKSDIESMERLLGNQTVLVGIYEDSPSAPVDHFRIQFKEGKLELYARGKDEPEAELKVSREYLETLVHNQKDYLQYPEKLDLGWMQTLLKETN